MYLSSNDTMKQKEYSVIYDGKHIDHIWSIIESKFHDYFNLFIQEVKANDGLNLDSLRKKGYKVTHELNIGKCLDDKFNKDIESFESEQKSYIKFFSTQDMKEYAEDTKLFKSELRKQCPVFRGLWNSKDEELKKWKESFNYSNPEDIYVAITNIIAFANKYKKAMDKVDYETINKYEKLKLEAVDSGSNDPSDRLGVGGVIGYGIMSIIMYCFHPEYFPLHLSSSLFALFFLSDKSDKEMPSGSSEFLMIEEGSYRGDMHFRMKNNYYYPYALYSLYALRLFLLLKESFAKYNFKINPFYRYVYLDSFFRDICRNHVEEIRTMVGVDEDPDKHFWSR